MHDSIRIEPATLDDLPELVELLHDLFSMEADFVPDQDRQLRGIQLILEQPSRGRIFVLRNDHRIIGMINLLITISTAEGGFVLLLEDLVVHRDHRGQGYGSNLLDHAVKFAREKNFLRITLLTDRGNDASKRFYLQRGFIESDMIPLRMLFPRLMADGFEDLGFAKVDSERGARCGRPEVIFCEGKTAPEVAAIAARIAEASGYVLGTRASRKQFDEVAKVLPAAEYHERARCITCGSAESAVGNFVVGILSAGTSDLAVAEEAAVTLAAFGQRVERIYDVGVAGLHRLMARLDAVRACSVLIVVAGMEGALPSVVSGLVDRPVIAVPTSVGYGASFGGLAALLGMLTSCGSKVTVVNIDNGFGAACAADAILRLAGEGAR